MTVGKTRDAGWQVGASRTLHHPLDRVWTTLVEHSDLWLGPGTGLPTEPGTGLPTEPGTGLPTEPGTGLPTEPGTGLPTEPGESWTADDGTCGELRSRHRQDRVRLTLRRPGDSHDSTVQVTVRPAGSRTMVRFHQERMRDADERSARRVHWQAMLDRLAAALES